MTAEPFLLDQADNPHPRMLTRAIELRRYTDWLDRNPTLPQPRETHALDIHREAAR